MYIGVDLGGTKIASAVTNLKDHKIAKKDVRPTQVELGKNKVYDNICNSIEELINSSEGGLKALKAIGVGVPGRINKNIILNAPNLPGWENINLAELLQRKYPVPVYLENDANAAGLAELLYGAGVGKKDFLYMTVSTGIGGGIISNGKLLTGHNHTAGEIGHMIVERGGTQCGCGQHGCLEAMASGTHLTNRLRKRLVENKPQTKVLELAGNKPEQACTKNLADAATLGDSFAIELIKENARYIAFGLNTYIHLLDPEIIIIGGGLANFGDIFFQEINDHLTEIHINAGVPLPPVVKSPLDQDSGVLGAVALAINSDE